MTTSIYNILKIFLAVSLFLPAFASADVSQSIYKDQGTTPLPQLTKEYYESGEVSLPAEYSGADKTSIAEAIQIALGENLDLKAATFSARGVAASLKGSYSLYDPVLSASFVSGDNREQLNSFVFANTVGEAEYTESSISLFQRLPIGTELSLAGILYKEETIPSPPINPSYDTDLSLSLLQPLLRGFGTTVTEQQIIFASKDKEISLQDLRASAMDVVAAVRDAFFDTLRAQYELSYRESSVALAKRIVRENKARVDAGILPPVEKLEAEVGLQSRESFLLDAQKSFGDAIDRFNLLLNANEAIYIPVIEPFKMEFSPVENEGLDAGLRMRPDVLKQLEEIGKKQTERSIAKNALLPNLDLVAMYNVNGLSDDAGDSIDAATDSDYDGWEVGVRFSYPLGSIESRNELKRTEVELMEKRALLAQLHNEVRNEVKSAIRNINVSRKKTEVAKRGHELAREKLLILLKSREVGLATTRDVLDGEEDLAIARTEQISSAADYFKAITEYLRVTGTLLASEGIVFEGDVTPDLQRIPFYLR